MNSHGARRRLVHHVTQLELLEDRKKLAVADLNTAFDNARLDGYDSGTLKVILKLRKLTPAQRVERRALEAIYMAALGLLDGEDLPNEARRRLSGEEPKDPVEPRLPGLAPAQVRPEAPAQAQAEATPPREAQPALVLKDPAEAKQDGAAAAAAGQRIYDNPYGAGDPCRAAWDEGWCGQRNSHGMDVPQAYQRKQPPKKKDEDRDRDRRDDAARGAA